MIEGLIRTDFALVDKREPVSSVAGWLKGEARDRPLVADRGRPWGILNLRRLTKSALPARERLERLAIGTGVVAEDATLEEVARALTDHAVDHMPVGDQRRAAGYVSALDVARALGVDGIAASDALVEVPALAEDQSMGEALHHFHEVSVDALPVVDARGRVRSILRRRALFEAGLNRDRADGRAMPGNPPGVLSGPVRDFATDAWEGVRAGAPGGVLLEALEDWGDAPVVDGEGRLVGMASPVSLLRAVTASGGRSL
ncbi:MAG TPA: CBS domain-containing protein [Candidatus Thermoplasmatota archaeon]|nr:CBS domain-containing protein [Candidatus Thermoplasmatota archaeon]